LSQTPFPDDTESDVLRSTPSFWAQHLNTSHMINSVNSLDKQSIAEKNYGKF